MPPIAISADFTLGCTGVGVAAAGWSPEVVSGTVPEDSPGTSSLSSAGCSTAAPVGAAGAGTTSACAGRSAVASACGAGSLPLGGGAFEQPPKTLSNIASHSACTLCNLALRHRPVTQSMTDTSSGLLSRDF